MVSSSAHGFFSHQHCATISKRLLSNPDDDNWGDDKAASLLRGMGFKLVSKEEEEDEGPSGPPPRIEWAKSTAKWIWETTRPQHLCDEWPVVHLPGFLSGEALGVVLRHCAAVETLAEPVEQYVSKLRASYAPCYQTHSAPLLIGTTAMTGN